MGRKRFTNEILSQILSACQGNGGSKTNIVYSSGLNFKTIVPYLELLRQNNLLDATQNKSTTFYKLTPKGYIALKYLNELDDLISEKEY